MEPKLIISLHTRVLEILIWKQKRTEPNRIERKQKPATSNQKPYKWNDGQQQQQQNWSPRCWNVLSFTYILIEIRQQNILQAMAAWNQIPLKNVAHDKKKNTLRLMYICYSIFEAGTSTFRSYNNNNKIQWSMSHRIYLCTIVSSYTFSGSKDDKSFV